MKSIEDFCGKSAQQSGVLKVRQAPVNSTVTGAFSHGFLMKAAVRSRRLMISGGTNIAGAAMPTREGITCANAAVAALVLAPAARPSSVSILIPFFTS